MTIKAGVILVGGGHSSGKKTVCQEIYKELSKLTGERNYISLVDMKDYLFLPIIDNEQTELIKKKNSQMVTPSRFNFKKILGDLSDENSKLYDGVEGRFPIFLVHGLYGLYNKELNEEATMKIFVDGDADTRFVRWKFSDTILPRGAEGNGIRLICDGIQGLISAKKAQLAVSEENDNQHVQKHLFPLSPDVTGLSALNIQAEEFSGQRSRFYDLA